MSNSVRPHRRQPIRLPRPWDSPGKNTGAGCHFLLQCMKVKHESEVAQLCLTLSDPMDCSLPGSSVHGIFQARVLEWSPIAFSGTARYPLANYPLALTIPTGNNTTGQFQTEEGYKGMLRCPRKLQLSLPSKGGESEKCMLQSIVCVSCSVMSNSL